MEVNEVLQTAAKTYGKNFRIDNEGTRRRQATELEAEKSDETTEAREPGAVLERMVQPVERFMERIGVEIKFHFHEESGEMQAEVMDPGGEKVIRKIPSDEILRLAASIKEMSDHFLNKAL